MSAPQSLTMALGRFIGNSIRAMHEAEDAALEAQRHADDRQNVDRWAFRRSEKLKDLEGAYYRRATAAHELVATMPAETIEEAAVISINALGLLDAINGIEISGEDKEYIGHKLTLAMSGLETVMRLLVKLSGNDPMAYGIDYYGGIIEEDGDPLLAGDPDAGLKAQWKAMAAAEAEANAVDSETKRARILDQKFMPALREAAALPALTLAGLSIKLQIQQAQRAWPQGGRDRSNVLDREFFPLYHTIRTTAAKSLTGALVLQL